MNSTQRTMQLVTGTLAILLALHLLWISFEFSHRIRPFSRFGWQNEMQALSFGIGAPGLVILLMKTDSTTYLLRSFLSTLLGFAASAGFLRYFTLSLALLSLGAFANAFLQTLSTNSAGPTISRALVQVLSALIAGVWGSLIIASYTLVGA